MIWQLRLLSPNFILFGYSHIKHNCIKYAENYSGVIQIKYQRNNGYLQHHLAIIRVFKYFVWSFFNGVNAGYAVYFGVPEFA